MVSGAGPSNAWASAADSPSYAMIRRKSKAQDMGSNDSRFAEANRTCWCWLASLANISTLLCVLVADVAGLDVLGLAAVNIGGL